MVLGAILKIHFGEHLVLGETVGLARDVPGLSRLSFQIIGLSIGVYVCILAPDHDYKLKAEPGTADSS